jgi:CheY-like chemotaxis protein
MERDHFVILLADDNSAIRMLLDEVFEDEGYGTVCCASEVEAIETLQRTMPDLAILDLQMENPVAGLRVLSYIRHEPRTAPLPAIVYSADALLLRTLEPQIKSLNAVALAKPFDVDGLIQLVRALLPPRSKHAR